MSAKPVRPKVGLLALTLELYESLAPTTRAERENWVRQRIVPAMTPLAEVVFDKAVFRRQDVEEAVGRFELAQVDAIVVMLLTYAPSQIALGALKRTRLPIVLWNTQELWGVNADFDFAALVGNHGVHGTQDLANVLLRSGVKFEYVTSHLGDEQATAGLGDFFSAAAAATRLRQARLGMLGYAFPGMGDFALDTTHMVATLGCTWENLAVEDYIRLAADAPSSAVDQLVHEYRGAYAVAGDVTDADLIQTARVELALRSLVADHRLDALTYQFLAFGEDQRTPTVPFVAASRLMAEGIGFGGEGDLIACAGTSLLHWLMPPASFSEIFTIDFENNALFMSHMGEANAAMHRRNAKIPLVARAAPITRTLHRQLALVPSFEPGPATLMALTLGPGQRWRLVVSAMTIPNFAPLGGGFASPHFKLQPASGRDVRQFLTAYAKAGGPHHNAVCFGDARPRLRALAEILDADYCEV